MAESARRQGQASGDQEKTDERRMFEQFQEWRQKQQQAAGTVSDSTMQGRAAEPAEEDSGSQSSLLSRDQLVEEAAVYIRKYYMRAKPDEDNAAFDLTEVFQIIPHVFEEEYPPKVLNRSTYFGWNSNVARFFNRRFLTPRWQIALEGVRFALDHDMISPTHEDLIEFRLKVGFPPIGPPLVLSPRMGLSHDKAKAYAEFLKGDRGKETFNQSEMDDRLREIQRDHAKLVRKLNKYRATIEEISKDLKKAAQGKKDLNEAQKQRLVEERKRYVSKVRDVQDEIEMLQDELQEAKKYRETA